MKTKEQRLNELYSKGLVNTIKGLFAGKNVNIDEDYYVLMADYIDSLDEVKDSMLLNPVEILNNLPNLVSNIQFNNVDFPTLGRPTMLTNPDLNMINFPL